MKAIKDDNIRFLVNWTLISTILIPLGAFLGGIVGLSVSAAFGYGYNGGESPIVITVVYCSWGTVMTVIISFMQWRMLSKKIGLSYFWIPRSVLGIIIGESIAGIILWKLDIQRGDLGWAQGGSILAESLIFAFSGTLIGIFQYPLLRKSYYKAEMWILASTIAWGFIPLVIFIFGGLTLGAITGISLIWILKLKK